jgi:hypothetical protein
MNKINFFFGHRHRRSLSGSIGLLLSRELLLELDVLGMPDVGRPLAVGAKVREGLDLAVARHAGENTLY